MLISPVFPRAFIYWPGRRRRLPGSEIRPQRIGKRVQQEMARRVSELIEVRVAEQQDEAPMSFLWRGRLYVVREVLGHWRERREWWSAAAARALHGEEWAPEAHEELDRECEIWRVEASKGRAYGNGVYDLSREPVSRVAPTEAWRLLQVAD